MIGNIILFAYLFGFGFWMGRIMRVDSYSWKLREKYWAAWSHDLQYARTEDDFKEQRKRRDWQDANIRNFESQKIEIAFKFWKPMRSFLSPEFKRSLGINK